MWQGLRGFPEPDPVRPCLEDARAFLGVLRLAAPSRSLRVVVFEGLYGPEHRTCFVDALNDRVRFGGLPDWISELHAIDVATFLGDADYLPLDGHLDARGHRRIAEAIAAVLEEAD